MGGRNRDFFSCFADLGDLFSGFDMSAGPRGLRMGMGKFRIFGRGDLKYVILELLSRKPMHGYEVMRALEEESGGCYTASAGSIYPTLQMLEDQGYVSCEERDGKKVYSITDEGREFLKQNGDVLADIVDRVSGFTDRFFRGEMRDVTHSFKNLAQATFDRATHWSDPEVQARIKEILDRAAQEIRDAKAANERA